MPVVSVKHREAEILEHVNRGGAGQRVIFNDQHRLVAHSELRTTIDRLRQGPGYGLAIPGCWKGPAVRVTGASTNKLNGGHYPSWRCWPAPAPRKEAGPQAFRFRATAAWPVRSPRPMRQPLQLSFPSPQEPHQLRHSPGRVPERNSRLILS